MPRHYNQSTRDVIRDLTIGMHVKTTDSVLTKTHFTATTQTELFTIVGCIAVKMLYIELTSAADANATVVKYRATFTTPVIAVADMCGNSGSIANLAAHRKIVWVGGVVATAAVLTASAGINDVEAAGKLHILGGETAAGANTVGTIGMLASTASQAGTITATAHLFYIGLSDGAYAEALL